MFSMLYIKVIHVQQYIMLATSVYSSFSKLRSPQPSEEMKFLLYATENVSQ